MCEKFSSGTIKQTYLRTKLSLQWIQQKVGWEDAHERHPTSPILISSQNAETHCRVKSRLIRNVHTKVDIPMVSKSRTASTGTLPRRPTVEPTYMDQLTCLHIQSPCFTNIGIGNSIFVICFRY